MAFPTCQAASSEKLASDLAAKEKALAKAKTKQEGLKEELQAAKQATADTAKAVETAKADTAAPAVATPLAAGGAARVGSVSGLKMIGSDIKGTADKEKQAAVKEAMMWSWEGYKKFAWGTDELMPRTKAGHNWLNQGGTIIDAMSTLAIMGEVEEFKKNAEWVKNELHFESRGDVSFFETTIRVLGGILSAYEFSCDLYECDKGLLDKVALLFPFSSFLFPLSSSSFIFHLPSFLALPSPALTSALTWLVRPRTLERALLRPSTLPLASLTLQSTWPQGMAPPLAGPEAQVCNNYPHPLSPHTLNPNTWASDNRSHIFS